MVVVVVVVVVVVLVVLDSVDDFSGSPPSISVSGKITESGLTEDVSSGTDLENASLQILSSFASF